MSDCPEHLDSPTIAGFVLDDDPPLHPEPSRLGVAKEDPLPVIFTDHSGRRFLFPFDDVKTWPVCYATSCFVLSL